MTWLVPPNYLAQISGVRRIQWTGRGPVAFVMLDGTVIHRRIPRRQLTALAKGDYLPFAKLARDGNSQ